MDILNIFIEKNDVPEFIDKRLNKDKYSKKDRYKIKRLKDVKDDDIYVQDKEKPSLLKMKLRVEAATVLQMEQNSATNLDNKYLATANSQTKNKLL